MTKGETNADDEKYAAVNAVDRDRATKAKSFSNPPWLKLEFEKNYFIHRVIINYRFYTDWFDPTDYCAQTISNYKGCVSLHDNVDVSVYQGEVKQKSCGTLKLTYGLEQMDQIYTLICDIEGDTVKLSRRNGELSVWEVAVTSTGVIQIYFENFLFSLFQQSESNNLT